MKRSGIHVDRSENRLFCISTRAEGAEKKSRMYGIG